MTLPKAANMMVVQERKEQEEKSMQLLNQAKELENRLRKRHGLHRIHIQGGYIETTDPRKYESYLQKLQNRKINII